ncbi:uncharacterized protein I303_104433 [Kwoniella dejecticola CBS 10117]|uniref:Uncharacterized protein n=1 Tax=Kwoniella dejecticola CBS 10117 TaxID=1296121 RepID=A0A1A6A5C0_9TREE|nr:uncharacterized protein I303_04588 [Kwoniella dejecticola CBS 10117]OBR85255.1 hypothetical protein I303_04588 [Kwoniella dejecticola CBS 10117]
MRVSQLYFALAASLASVSVNAHIALWDEGMYGWDPNDPNQSEPVLPLMHLPFNEWWFHGYINKPPQDGKFMSLPSGGTYKGQVACNKALTTYGQNDYQQTGIYACDGDGASGGIGAMHTSDPWASPDPKDVKGCGIAIAYESDVSKIQPEDFAVISVNYTCPWFKDVDFQIPADLPPCPEGGCHCMWGWIHAADAGSEQNYFLGYRCNITGATGVTPIPPPKTANKCNYPTDTSNCTVGAKQPHYWYQNERNNNPQGEYDPPFYNNEYGFINGAQTDLFASVGGAEVGTGTSSNATAPSEAAASSSLASASASGSGAYGDAQPSTSAATAQSINAQPTSSTTSNSEPESVSDSDVTTQTTVTVQTTMVRPSATASVTAPVQAQVAIATSSTEASPTPTVATSSASASANASADSTGSAGKTCSIKRKRHLDRLLNSPELMKKHILRNERRRERLRKRRIASGVQMAKAN